MGEVPIVSGDAGRRRRPLGALAGSPRDPVPDHGGASLRAVLFGEVRVCR
jgi:hypothetical protein